MDMGNKSETDSLLHRNNSNHSEAETEEEELADDLSESDLEKFEEIYQDLPTKEREKLDTIIARRETFSGPLPHPILLKEYEEVLPGAADRIIKMAEKQMSHRHGLENKTVNSNNTDSRLGVLFAGFIGVTGIIMGGILVINGHALAGTLFGGGPLATLVGVYLKGTSLNNKNQDYEEQEEASTEE